MLHAIFRATHISLHRSRRRTFVVCMAFISTLMAISAPFMPVYAAEETSDKTFTVGILRTSETTLAEKTADLLFAVLAGNGNVELVEREKMVQIAREKTLSAALSSPQKRLQLGKTVGADFLIVLGSPEQKGDAESISVRAVDCRTGCIAHDTQLAPPKEEKLQSIVETNAEVLLKKMQWLKNVSRQDLTPLSIIDPTPLTPGSSSDQSIAQRLKRQLQIRFSQVPEIVCLEREELRKARREIEEFKGEAAEFWNSSVIITGSVGLQGENLRELFVSLNLRLPQGNQEQVAEVTDKSSKLRKFSIINFNDFNVCFFN